MTFGFALRAGSELSDNLIHVFTPRIILCHAATNSCTNYVELHHFSLQCTEKGTNKTLIYTHIFKYLPQPHEACAGLHCGLPVAHAAVIVFECAQKRRRCHINASCKSKRDILCSRIVDAAPIVYVCVYAELCHQSCFKQCLNQQS